MSFFLCFVKIDSTEVTICIKTDVSLKCGGTGGREPGRTGGGRGTGGGRRKGGRRDLYDGGKRERNSKSQAVFLLLLTPSQRNEPNNVS